MESDRFERISRLFAGRRLSRRQAMASSAIALTSGVAGSQAAAQSEAPVASPVSDFNATDKTMYLFVQSFQSGTLEANTEDDRHTLTLNNGLGQTLYFGDRPSRDVGVSPTDTFLQGLGFSEQNPPNAALIVDVGEGDSDLAVLELYDPTYDTESHTATYQVKGLEAWEDTLQLGLQDSPADLSGMATTFESAHLLIDDCADGIVDCWIDSQNVASYTGVSMCYNYLICMPCEPYGHVQPDKCSTQAHWGQKCIDDYAESWECQDLGSCYADWAGAVFLGCQ